MISGCFEYVSHWSARTLRRPTRKTRSCFSRVPQGRVCAWNRHSKCRRGRLPGSNVGYWKTKLARNVERDAAAIAQLKNDGAPNEIMPVCVLPSSTWLCVANSAIGAGIKPGRALNAHASAIRTKITQTALADLPSYSSSDRRHDTRRCHSLCGHRLVVAGRVPGLNGYSSAKTI